MSLLVLPSIQSPPNISFTWPIKQSPMGKTITQTPASGRGELRIPLYQFPRWDFTWDLGYIKGDATQVNSAWQQLLNFFIAVQFGAADWLFLHPFDNTTNPNTSPYQVIATGDGATKKFTMYRSLIAGGAQDLIQNFVAAPNIYINNVLQGSGYSIDQYGTLTFVTAPTTGLAIAWSGQFYYRCHFLDDVWGDLDEFLYQVSEMKSLKFRSVLL